MVARQARQLWYQRRLPLPLLLPLSRAISGTLPGYEPGLGAVTWVYNRARFELLDGFSA
jgi:hypothetical protein